MAREAGKATVPYRRDRRMVGVGLSADLYETISRISRQTLRSRASLLNEGAEIIAARYSAREVEEEP